MPQLWLTYEELGALFKLDPAQARGEVVRHQWPRRRCSDHLTRVKLPPGAAHEYMISYVRAFSADLPLNALTDDLVVTLRAALRSTPHGEGAEKSNRSAA